MTEVVTYPMNRERLEKLETMLRALPVEKTFHIGTWATKTEGEGHVCGTSACACGYAALDSYFTNLGLQLHVDIYKRDSETGEEIENSWEKVIPTSIQEFNTLIAPKNVHVNNADIIYFHNGVEFESMDAAAVFFGFSDGDDPDEVDSAMAEFLFWGNAYSCEYPGVKVTAVMVADRIRKVLDGEFTRFEEYKGRWR